MRAVLVILLFSTAAFADVAKPVEPVAPNPPPAPTDKVEEVDLDAFEDDARPPKPTTAAGTGTGTGAGSTVIEEVRLDELEEASAIVEYERSRWLLMLPLLAALIVMWNVDWRDVRLKAELAAARAKRAPTKKGTKTW